MPNLAWQSGQKKTSQSTNFPPRPAAFWAINRIESMPRSPHINYNVSAPNSIITPSRNDPCHKFKPFPCIKTSIAAAAPPASAHRLATLAHPRRSLLHSQRPLLRPPPLPNTRLCLWPLSSELLCEANSFQGIASSKRCALHVFIPNNFQPEIAKASHRTMRPVRLTYSSFLARFTFS